MTEQSVPGLRQWLKTEGIQGEQDTSARCPEYTGSVMTKDAEARPAVPGETRPWEEKAVLSAGDCLQNSPFWCENISST